MGLAEQLAEKYRKEPRLEGYDLSFFQTMAAIDEALELAAQEAEKECASLGERAVGFHVAARIRKLKE